MDKKAVASLCIIVALLGYLSLVFSPWSRASTLPNQIGHRCHHGVEENTIKALRDVAKMKNVACEIDVWKLRTGEFVVVHDPTWRRTINPKTIPKGTSGYVNQSTWAQVSQMRTYGGQKVPRLEEFLKEAKRLDVKILLETKNYVPTEILKSYPGVQVYMQPQKASCKSEMYTVAKRANLMVGFKGQQGCNTTPKALANSGANLGVQFTGKLLNNKGAWIRKMNRRGIEPIAMFTAKKKEHKQLTKYGASYITPYPKG